VPEGDDYMAFDAITSISGTPQGIRPVKTTGSGQGDVSFKDMLLDAINGVNQLQRESDAITEDFIAGRTDSIHDVMIAGTKASLALDFMIEVRNKIMDAYQEIMRMQV
jgi:flagellar hook-basal body complex protein FliE